MPAVLRMVKGNADVHILAHFLFCTSLSHYLAYILLHGFLATIQGKVLFNGYILSKHQCRLL